MKPVTVRPENLSFFLTLIFKRKLNVVEMFQEELLAAFLIKFLMRTSNNKCSFLVHKIYYQKITATGIKTDCDNRLLAHYVVSSHLSGWAHIAVSLFSNPAACGSEGRSLRSSVSAVPAAVYFWPVGSFTVIRFINRQLFLLGRCRCATNANADAAFKANWGKQTHLVCLACVWCYRSYRSYNRDILVWHQQSLNT